MSFDPKQYSQRLSIFRIGVVFSVDGRTVRIKVDKDKNLSHLIYRGRLIKNVSVGSYLKILKGFDTIVCQVETEYIKEIEEFNPNYHNKAEEFARYLNVKLIGYFSGGKYYKGIKEMPLIGNLCLLMDDEEFLSIHRFAEDEELTLRIGHLLTDDMVPIELGINKLFSSHIGIFGNTGSGKSYTLANLYKKLFEKVGSFNNFKENAKFLLYDFNGEYAYDEVITKDKKVYKLSTQNLDGGKIPLKKDDLLNPELFNILANATEKTQQPFIKRALRLYENVHEVENPDGYVKAILRRLIEKTIYMSDHLKSKLILDYFEQILPSNRDENGIEQGLQYDLSWYSKSSCFITGVSKDVKFFDSVGNKCFVQNLAIYKAVDKFDESPNFIETIISYLYIQLIQDLLNNRAQNDHIAPAINKLKALNKDFDKVFVIDDGIDFWDEKIMVVVDLNNVNINIKKLIPLLLSYKLYAEHKKCHKPTSKQYLNIIIDEAHNILSYDSLRESETWKDFRLETFEEIIKEGRKFGVFMTIASQRPSDISATIISQLHNYFIHRLINDKDLEMIEKAVSYLDKLSFETLPILPIGACVLSGTIADLPIIVQIDKLEGGNAPKSSTILLKEWWMDK